MGFDPASRYKFVDEALHAPGRSLVTRTEKGPFVDLGVELNKFDSLWSESSNARVYLAVAELRELAEGAGIFDEIQALSIPNEAAAYQRGYEEGLTARGDLDALADRLDVAVGTLRHRADDLGSVASEGSDDDAPAVLVVDGDDHRDGEPDGQESDREHGEAGGQGDGPRRQRRRAVVPVGPSDGDNPFRI